MEGNTRLYATFWALLIAAIVVHCTGCSSPEKTMNFFTPDRLGYGIMNGTMSWRGSGDLTTIFNSDIGDIYWDVDGEQESSILYLEWDLPPWEDNTEADRYVRDRLRAFNLMLEREDKEEEFGTGGG